MVLKISSLEHRLFLHNPAFVAHQCQDQLFTSWLLSSTSSDLPPQFVGYESASSIWNAITQLFAAIISKSYEFKISTSNPQERKFIHERLPVENEIHLQHLGCMWTSSLWRRSSALHSCRPWTKIWAHYCCFDFKNWMLQCPNTYCIASNLWK